MTEQCGQKPVLILGAGVNGSALTRELILNGIPVRLIDKFDIAFGATSRSSRLIHGGLRYLEYGDFQLVKESLQERSRLRKLAPQFVEPLRLSIPVKKRTGGLFSSAARFLGLSRHRFFRIIPTIFRQHSDRGMWLLRMGLQMYDRFSQDAEFPPHEVRSLSDPQTPRVNSEEFRWVCTYTDAQMRFPERFVIALLEDARKLAQSRDIEFRVETYRRVTLNGTEAEIHDAASGERLETFAPSAVVNATGAWGDQTLKEAGVKSRKLFGGTKGSHFITSQPRIREALRDGGLYAEATDGRMVFVLPFGDAVLVGTTDERFDQPPEKAVASDAELDYLLGLVNELFPTARLKRSDVDLHYSGVRPLPYSPQSKAGGISRDHHIERHDNFALPTFTLVGGKLTTARAFAEEAADQLLKSLSVTRTESTRDRLIPGAEDFPCNDSAQEARQLRIAMRFDKPVTEIEKLWPLFGNRLVTVLKEANALMTSTSLTSVSSSGKLDGTEFPFCIVPWMIKHEWATRLNDLVERRLLLIYEPRLTARCLRQLADALVAAGHLAPADVVATVAETTEHLKTDYGKQVTA